MSEDAIRKAQGKRLAKARELAGYRSARAAAIENEWPESSYRAHEGGTRTIGQDDADRYARRFRTAGVHVTGQMILYGGDISGGGTGGVRVMGRIGAGSEILPEFEQVPENGLFQIEAPFSVPDDSIAFEVQGDSMYPRFDDGDVIICWREGRNLDEIIGWEAAVKTEDGRRYLKTVLRGAEKGTFDLESHNAPPIRGVKLDWAAEVGAIIRRNQWRRLDESSRKKVVKKALAGR